MNYLKGGSWYTSICFYSYRCCEILQCFVVYLTMSCSYSRYSYSFSYNTKCASTVNRSWFKGELGIPHWELWELVLTGVFLFRYTCLYCCFFFHWICHVTRKFLLPTLCLENVLINENRKDRTRINIWPRTDKLALSPDNIWLSDWHDQHHN